MASNKLTILIIDDEKTVLDSLVNQLKNAYGFNFSYETASSVDEAWEIVNELTSENRPIALVISDWLMPKTKGDQFLIELYAAHPQIKQIMLSGYADEESVQKAFDYARMKAFVPKPWDEVEFLTLIDRILNEE
jgi:YesN/AraC family two-component response regulator